MKLASSLINAANFEEPTEPDIIKYVLWRTRANRINAKFPASCFRKKIPTAIRSCRLRFICISEVSTSCFHFRLRELSPVWHPYLQRFIFRKSVEFCYYIFLKIYVNIQIDTHYKNVRIRKNERSRIWQQQDKNERDIDAVFIFNFF